MPTADPNALRYNPRQRAVAGNRHPSAFQPAPSGEVADWRRERRRPMPVPFPKQKSRQCLPSLEFRYQEANKPFEPRRSGRIWRSRRISGKLEPGSLSSRPVWRSEKPDRSGKPDLSNEGANFRCRDSSAGTRHDVVGDNAHSRPSMRRLVAPDREKCWRKYGTPEYLTSISAPSLRPKDSVIADVRQ